MQLSLIYKTAPYKGDHMFHIIVPNNKVHRAKRRII
jgi:hypothetical protein